MKKISLLVAITLAFAYGAFKSTVDYLYMQAKGQIRILWNAKPIEIYLNDISIEAELKDKILLIQEVRQYAVDSLGLNDTKNYTTLFDQEGQEILWNVTASEKYSLKPFEWYFPIVGKVGYKGFFDKNVAIAEQKKLDDLDYDTYLYSVSAWSTLGWFKDPILSNMLNRNTGQIAELIIHELTHATIFVKDSLTFNENLATFVGSMGAIEFLKYKYPRDTTHLTEYTNQEYNTNRYLNHMMRGARDLDSLYSTMSGFSENDKQNLKNAKIQQIIANIDTISFHGNPTYKDYLSKNPPNNAQFASYRRYHSIGDLLSQEYHNNFGGDFKAYILHLKNIYGK